MIDTLALIPLMKQSISENEDLMERLCSQTNKIDSVEYVFKEGRKKVKLNLIFHSDHLSLRYNHGQTKTYEMVTQQVFKVLDDLKVPYKTVDNGADKHKIRCLYINF